MESDVKLGASACYNLPGQVVTCRIGHWDALNVFYHMHYSYTWVLWNIQRRLQYIKNINFDIQID